MDGAMYCIQSRTHFLNSAPPLRELVEIDGTLPLWPDLIRQSIFFARLLTA
jgi:hypothetical protein